MRSRRVYWTIIVLLLLPLGLFWVSVVARSHTLSRLLFGATHTPFRDLLPTVVLPAVALGVSVNRLRHGGLTDEERNMTRAVMAVVATSYLIMLGYLLAERLR